jgi:hypothetical protein
MDGLLGKNRASNEEKNQVINEEFSSLAISSYPQLTQVFLRVLVKIISNSLT